MRGRVGRGDPDFGSDSFLDIIANLVGILVILIVLAGLRAAQVPDVPEVAESEPTSSSMTSSPIPEASAPAARIRPPVIKPDQSVTSILPNPESILGQGVVPREVAESQVQELQATVAGLESRLTSLPVDEAMSDLKTVQSELAAVSRQLPALQQKLASEDLSHRRSLVAAADFDAEYQALRKQLIEVNRTFEELKTAERPVEELELRINPVGRRSRAEEILFRIEDDRVVLLPAMELFGKAHLQSGSLTPLTRTSDAESGTVGPLNGVSLDYETRVVAAMVPSSTGSATYALQKLMRGTLRVNRLAPTEDWRTAIEEQGIVSRKMLSAPRDAFARLFVAPDSFEAARRVAAFIRSLGHGVATAPIEAGTDIRISFGNGSDAIVQ